jgi:hypothetical protein
MSTDTNSATGTRIWKREEEATPGRVIPQSPHRGPLPGFLICKYLNLPPGVLMTRVRLDLVLSTNSVKELKLEGLWWEYKEDGDGM